MTDEEIYNLYTIFLVRAACVRCHRTKCPLLMALCNITNVCQANRRAGQATLYLGNQRRQVEEIMRRDSSTEPQRCHQNLL